jgi:DNA-binding NarL/FixJ family response regulator
VLLATEAYTAKKIIEQRGDEIYLVVLDILLPGMNGFDFMLEIEKSHPEVPVAFISIKDQPPVRKKALGMGAVDFISKGQPAKEIADQVVKMLLRAV